MGVFWTSTAAFPGRSVSSLLCVREGFFRGLVCIVLVVRIRVHVCLHVYVCALERLPPGRPPSLLSGLLADAFWPFWEIRETWKRGLKGQVCASRFGLGMRLNSREGRAERGFRGPCGNAGEQSDWAWRHLEMSRLFCVLRAEFLH